MVELSNVRLWRLSKCHSTTLGLLIVITSRLDDAASQIATGK